MHPHTKKVLSAGLFAGVIGYGTVVVVVAALNVVAGRSPFYTPALFGAALFNGLTDPAALVITPQAVLSYNAVHLFAFLLLGLITSWLVALAEKYPTAHYLVLVTLIFIAFHVYVALAFFAQPLLGAEAWWHIGVGSLAAAGLMGWYLWRRYPLIKREMELLPMGETAYPPER